MHVHKVSVIVPIYKVEKYLKRCVNSIITQTYTNLEIILVDDGSPDSCGEIADDYAKTDSRIKVIHKENGGLSDARNHGMLIATGEFTLFVDSDDWIENVMIEEMVNNSVKYNADIVQTAFYYAYDDYLMFDNRYSSQDDPHAILDNNSLMFELVKDERVKHFAWGKLYKTGIIKDISFEKGVLFEDVFWQHKVMYRASTYLILNQPMCYYYQRTDSIAANYTLRSLDIIRGLKVMHCFIEEFYENLIDESFKQILKTCLIHYDLLIKNKPIDPDGYYRKEIEVYIKSNLNKLKKAVENQKYLKTQLYLFTIHPHLNILLLFAAKVLRKLKITAQPHSLQRLEYQGGKEHFIKGDLYLDEWHGF